MRAILTRRQILGSALAGSAATALAGAPALAAQRPIKVADLLRGSIDATQYGARPGAGDDQSAVLQKALELATQEGRPLFLPPGRYQVSNLTLPAGAQLVGIAGGTRIEYRGGGHCIVAENADRITLSGLVIDGANRMLGDYTSGLVHLSNIATAILEDCELQGSSKNGFSLERCGGRIERCTIGGAADAGILSMEARGLAIRNNTVETCANGGILVHRWSEGSDGTQVFGNRISAISARDGGTGQNGNGINVFRAHDVMVANNHIADCAFSAIRSNTGSNVQIANNTCLRSGETAIYSEFAFQGAVIANNIVDGAAKGISISNFREGGRLSVCSGNLVRNLVTVGPYPSSPPGFGWGIAAEADTVVTGNTIEGAPVFGIGLGWGPYLRNVAATGNILRLCGVGIAVSVVEGAEKTLISGNVISDSRLGAIIGYRWAEATTGDLSLSGADRYPHLTISNNTTM